MIAASLDLDQPERNGARPHWQSVLAEAFSDPLQLLSELQLDPTLAHACSRAARDFPLRVPRGFVRRMRRGDPLDPLLLQVLPLGLELEKTPGYLLDPVSDLDHRRTPGLLHKYHGRALLITTGACAVHCRYCFRRHFPYSSNSAVGSQWQHALTQLRTDSSIRELILSGGDPLSLSDARLERLTQELQSIPHLLRLRIHTRYPIVLPERIDSSLVRWLKRLPWQTVMVVHSNHANELDAEVVAACQILRSTGITLLNQTVLLARVNDSTDALEELSEKLFTAGILPYYLHLLDRVQGAAHFEVAQPRAVQLVRELRQRLPGYLVPLLVREIPGELSKTPIAV